jgi:tRNA(fMet)-specific endonuclease VapC
MVMLDTNICIYILKNSLPGVKARLKAESHLSISAVVYAELCVGIEQSEAPLQAKRKEQLGQFVSLLEVAPWDEEAASHYGNIRAALQRQGLLIGNNMDMLIAAHARSLNETLVSNNVREFERVAGLRLENWV